MLSVLTISVALVDTVSPGGAPRLKRVNEEGSSHGWCTEEHGTHTQPFLPPLFDCENCHDGGPVPLEALGPDRPSLAYLPGPWPWDPGVLGA